MRIGKGLVSFAGALTLAAGVVGAQEPLEITTTGVGPTGFVKAIVESYHDIVRAEYPGASATFLPGTITGGMVQAAAGDVDLTVGVTPVELIFGLEGRAPFQDPLEGEILHVLTMFDTIDFWFIADKAWADANGIQSIGDIAETQPAMNLALGALSTPYIVETAKEVFANYGFTLDDVESWGGSVNTYPSGRGIDDLRDGKVDVQIVAGLHPDARLVDLNRSRPLVWLDVSEEVVAAVAPEIGLPTQRLSASHYDFLSEDKLTFRAPAALMAGAHVPEEDVYRFVRALGENIDRVQAIHPALAAYSPETMIYKSPRVDYHPGALRYYREMGWVD